MSGADGPAPPERRDLRPRAERLVRSAWRGEPPAWLRGAEALFGLGAGLRALAHDSGLAGSTRASVPVLSVGSLAVGGSGKTPVAAAAARWAREAGASPAVVTPGFPDEVAVHASLNPAVPVVGDRDRAAAVRRARRAGADLVVLDDGFQHRKLARDLDWVVLDEERVRGGRRRLLPAGPGREAWGALSRADALVLTRREEARDDAREEAREDRVPVVRRRGSGELEARLERQFPSAAVARCHLRAGPLVPVNRAASARGEPRPRVAFASIMKGEDFLEALRGRRPEIEHEYLFPDHGPVPDVRLDEMIRLAGAGGLVGTRKDVVKVQERVADSTPLWCASEELAWSRGSSALRRQVGALGGGP